MNASTIKQRAGEELRNYAIVAGYLCVCFAALLLYKDALLQEQGLSLFPHGYERHSALEMLAKCLLLLLVLVPLIAFKEFVRVMGPGALRGKAV